MTGLETKFLELGDERISPTLTLGRLPLSLSGSLKGTHSGPSNPGLPLTLPRALAAPSSEEQW